VVIAGRSHAYADVDQPSEDPESTRAAKSSSPSRSGTSRSPRSAGGRSPLFHAADWMATVPTMSDAPEMSGGVPGAGADPDGTSVPRAAAEGHRGGAEILGTDTQRARFGPTGTVDYAAIGCEAATLLREPGWIHRRVEHIFIGPSILLERRMSIDFSVPEAAISRGAGAGHWPVTYLPLSVLQKRPPVMGLDLRDEHARPLPLLTTYQNKLADEAALKQLARDLVLGAELSHQLEVDLELIAGTDRRSAQVALTRVLRPPQQLGDYALRTQLAGDVRFREITSAMVSSAVLWVPIMNEPGRRRIIKYRYEIPADSYGAGSTGQLGWEPWAEWFQLPHIGPGVSYHLHVRSKPSWEMVAAGLVIEEGGGPDLIPPGENTELAHEHAHLYVGEHSAMTEGYAWVAMRVQRTGELLGAWLASAGITALLVGFWVACPHIFAGEPDRIVAAVSVLVIVPLVMVAYLARPMLRLHSQQAIAGVRALPSLAGALPIAAAIVGISSGEHATRTAWFWLAVAGLLITVLLTLSLLLPRSAR
jgi:hypothetical protein